MFSELFIRCGFYVFRQNLKYLFLFSIIKLRPLLKTFGFIYLFIVQIPEPIKIRMSIIYFFQFYYSYILVCVLLLSFCCPSVVRFAVHSVTCILIKAPIYYPDKRFFVVRLDVQFFNTLKFF